MLSRKPLRTLLLIAIGVLATLGACSDAGEELTGPPIPSLGEQVAGSGVGTVDTDPLSATCACVSWSCTIGDCGYDPPTDDRGACCVERDCSASEGVPKPSCEGGPGGRTWEPDCGPDTSGSCERDFGEFCDTWCTCCY